MPYNAFNELKIRFSAGIKDTRRTGLRASMMTRSAPIPGQLLSDVTSSTRSDILLFLADFRDGASRETAA